MKQIEEISSSDLAVFRKKLKMLEKFKGKNTELITQYIPEAADRSSVMNQLTEEISQSSNIKSPTTRKNVQGALRKITTFLKKINFNIPKNGIVVFAGNVSPVEGRSDIRLFTVNPVKNLKVKLYWCDSEFHLDYLKEMLAPNDFYAIVTIDKNEATIAQLYGKKYEILGHFTSMVPGKTRAGGQSAQRFERLREEATQDFFKKISEKINSYFANYGDKLKGMIIGGPGITKNYFINKGLIHHEISKKIIGVLDISYTDESGIREMVQKSEELLKDTDLMKEKIVMDKFLGEVARNGLATYGQKEVEDVIESGKASVLLISEAIEWMVVKKLCGKCNSEEIEIIKTQKDYEESKWQCSKCDATGEIVEEVDYMDYMLEKAKSIGAEVIVVSTETAEGKQFYDGFGGLAAMLRYK
ncbi:MAG: peptide chain release factor aRF-1 [archaeon]|jgi:peptide chain release factor subunit 1